MAFAGSCGLLIDPEHARFVAAAECQRFSEVAADVQERIPFIIWMSDEFIRQKAIRSGQLESQRMHSQGDISHTVMGAFSMRSNAYVGAYDIFSEMFSNK